jgi:hypothetical protein
MAAARRSWRNAKIFRETDFTAGKLCVEHDITLNSQGLQSEIAAF